MTAQTNLVDVVAGYNAYINADELAMHAGVDPLATTPVCAATAASSAGCAQSARYLVSGAAAGISAGYTFGKGC